MDQHQLKEKLLEAKRVAEAELKEHEKFPDFGDEPGFDDETSESQEYANKLSVARVVKDRLLEIEHALQKFEKGSYGRCEKCGRGIAMGLLDIVPESRLCQDCKKTAISD
ncbi:hypothetical protein HY504_00235 [Candidatus Wolfebacteria bacterium]|nr:hypothetical protein [Candidatus Wolfebacteria bacterium]